MKDMTNTSRAAGASAPVAGVCGGAGRGRAATVTMAVCSLLFGGCTALDPVPDHTRFYSLSGASDIGQLAAVAPSGAPTIGVRITSVASHLRQSSIVVRTGEHEMRYEGSHRWAGRLEEGVGRTLAAEVQRVVGTRTSVVLVRPLRAAPPDVLIEIDLLACEGQSGSQASALVVADWRIFGEKDARPALSGRFRVEKPGWNGANFGQLAALLEAALGDLAGAVAGPAAKLAGGG